MHYIVQKLLKKINKDSSNAEQFVTSFIEQYSSINEDCNLQVLLNRIQSIFNLIKNLDLKKNFQVNFYDSQYEESKVHILEIAHTNRPFLLNSVLNYLHFINAKIINEISIDCNIKIKNRKIEFDNNQTSSNITILQITFECLEDKTKYQRLVSDLQYILKSLNLAIEDWHAIIEKINNISQEIQEYTQDNSYINFLNWLIDKKFIFLALIDCTYKKSTHDNIIVKKNLKSSLGITKFKDDPPLDLNMFDNSEENLNNTQNLPIEIRTSNNFSLIHRNKYMDCIVIKKMNSQKEIIGEYQILGMFSSIVFHQDIRHIPIIDNKILEIERKANFITDSENHKNLIAILQDLPRDNLFQNNTNDLFEIAMTVLKILKKPQIKVFLQTNTYAKFIKCLIFIPYNAANNELHRQIEKLFHTKFQANLIEKTINVNEFEIIQMQLVFSVKNYELHNIDLKNLEENILNLSKNWIDLLKAQYNLKDLQERYLLKKYCYVFSKKYQRDYSPQIAKQDIKQIEILLNSAYDSKVKFQQNDLNIKLTIYSKLNNEEMHLSKLIPIISNMGMETIKNNIYNLNIKDHKVILQVFELKTSHTLNEDALYNLEQTLNCILEDTVQSDILNRLIIEANLQWREVILLRAILRYLKQLNCRYSTEYIQNTLLQYPKITSQLLDLFNTKFKLNVKKSRHKLITLLNRKIEKAVWEVPQIAEENIFKYLLQIINAMVRTNFFQNTNDAAINYRDTNYKNYISFKIDSQQLEIMPLPKSHSEIFVYSKNMEGIHLRGGKISRGGIRWSDRIEDFRNEVLGLMKAQITKNTIIVPTGAKGGFIITNPNKKNINDVVGLYKLYLFGLLDLIDNIDENLKIIKPPQIITHDQDDYYIVAAADKGTSTFSNYANEVAIKYNFWLQDAFASGGSNGYDHKKMQITSRGAWISVQKHFAFLGKNIEKEKFTVVGIGDMSGDVFGNGMLLSKNIQLIAAFNHKHIFIDPNPDNLISYEERQRLFNLPRSNWSDYNQQLLSKGGGIFERTAKKILLSPEARKKLSIKVKEITPNELIQAILKAPVDLLWNGGIGTYIKSSTETNSEVFDKSNDNLRINGNEIRCKIVAEGGNLGCTQLGRIEFSKENPDHNRINTDFIDNSAGVDCSDHEVNIKIALVEAMHNKKITFEERNAIMSEMSNEVAEIVLRDNHNQNFTITLIEIKSQYEIFRDARVLRKLEELSLINRKVEFLPTEDKIRNMIKNKQSFSRPEICVLLSYVKMFLYDHHKVSDYDFLQDKIFQEKLFDYFPKLMHKKFSTEIVNHKLKNEIIATFICNEVVNKLGINLLQYIHDISNAKYQEIIQVYFIVVNIFDISGLWQNLENNLFHLSKDKRYLLLSYIDKFFLYTIINILYCKHQYNDIHNISSDIKKYQKNITTLDNNLDSILTIELKNVFHNRAINIIGKKKECKNFVNSIIKLDLYKLFINIIEISQRIKFDLLQTAEIYFYFYEKLMIYKLNDILYKFSGNNYWDSVSTKIMINQFNTQHLKIIEYTIQKLKMNTNQTYSDISDTIFDDEKRAIFDHYLSFLHKHVITLNTENINLGNLNVILNKLDSFIGKLD